MKFFSEEWGDEQGHEGRRSIVRFIVDLHGVSQRALAPLLPLARLLSLAASVWPWSSNRISRTVSSVSWKILAMVAVGTSLSKARLHCNSSWCLCGWHIWSLGPWWKSAHPAFLPNHRQSQFQLHPCADSLRSAKQKREKGLPKRLTKEGWDIPVYALVLPTLTKRQVWTYHALCTRVVPLSSLKVFWYIDDF